jgi:hypothetical protein
VRNVVPFKAPEPFRRAGIDWTRNAANEGERALREAFLSYESSCGASGLVSLLLLSIVSRREKAIGEDLQAAAGFAEIILAMQLHKHQSDALDMVQSCMINNGPIGKP